MREAATLKTEIPNDQRHLIAVQLRTMEESCLRLLELLRPFDASLVRRQPLPQEKAEPLQRMIARLRTGISQAAWDLGLPKVNRNPCMEAATWVATLDEGIHELLQFQRRDGVSENLAGYIEKLTEEFHRIVTDIDRVVGHAVSVPGA
jgi:hypothetical protein